MIPPPHIFIALSLSLCIVPFAARAGGPGPAAGGSDIVPGREARDEPSATEPALEWKIFPVIGGNSDIGFQFGATGLAARLGNGKPGVPYIWSLRVKASMSVKNGPAGGAELPVHDDFMQFEWRGDSGDWRVNADLAFWQAANAGYYGLGNRSSGRGSGVREGPRAVRYRRSETSAYLRARRSVSAHWRFMFGMGARRVAPGIYSGSSLACDARREPLIAGVHPHLSLIGLAGVEWDTRNNEIAPSHGYWFECILRGSPGPVFRNDLTFGGATVNLRFYFPLFRDYLVLAFRALGDAVFGNPPLHELSRSGNALPGIWLLGGVDGVRGVPEGRYQGRIRALGNLELRVMGARFSIRDRRFNAGFVLFLDGGRVWADWKPRRDLDGTAPNLHWGAGCGVRLLWGETVMIRLDAAYSPSAPDPRFPVGIYFDLGQIF